MKRIAVLLVFIAGLVPAASAQKSGQVSVYVDYFRLSQTSSNFAGLGGRLSSSAKHRLQLEGEINYDFNQVFTEGFTNTGTGTVTLQRSNLRILHGLIGPKFEAGHGIVRPFLTLKGGFVNFRLDPRPATFNTFLSSVDNLRSRDLSAVLYPGAGFEAHLGPVGLRLDAGDEIYFSNGTHHNVRVAFGPVLRF
jgi:hypothetical protein